MATTWNITYGDEVERELPSMLKSGEIDSDSYMMIREWIHQVKNYGPNSLRQTQRLSDFFPENVTAEILARPLNLKNFWNDHDLIGVWRGYRSSSYSHRGRIIYKIEGHQLKIVKVERITPTHNYRK